MKRKSRSRSSSEEVKEDEKFNFDVLQYEIDPNKMFVLSVSRVKDYGGGVECSSNNGINNDHKNANVDADIDNVKRKRKEISNMILPIEHHQIGVNKDSNMRRRQKQKPNFTTDELVDPLTEQVYSIYHKKMMKQETRMMNDEANYSELEADRLEGILESLEISSWRSILPKITVINNVTDEVELLHKRELTQQAIRSMLDKYKDMKHRISLLQRKQRHIMIDPHKQLDKLYSNVDKSLIIGYHSSSDEEENDLDVYQIRTRRKMMKHRIFAPTLIVPLSVPLAPTNFQYGIVADPLKSPFIVKFTKEERLKYLNKDKDFTKRYRSIENFPNQEMRFVSKSRAVCELGSNSKCQKKFIHD